MNFIGGQDLQSGWTEFKGCVLNTGMSDIESKAGALEINQLVQKAKNRDQNAFDRLARMHWDRIYRMAFYRTRSREDAEDLAQDVFVKAYKSLPGLKDDSKFGSWLYAVGINTVRDFHRKRKMAAVLRFKLFSQAEDGHGEKAGPPSPLQSVIRRDFWRQVEIVSRDLSRWEREVFFLRFLDQLAIREIAEALNKSESAVKTHLYRAVAKFRKHSPAFLKYREEVQ